MAVLDLLKQLLKHKGWPGRVALVRAAHELAGGLCPGDDKSGVHWEYLLQRWGTLSDNERIGIARSEILPLLLSRDRDPQQFRPKGVPPEKPPSQSELGLPLVSAAELNGLGLSM